jgi:hypothetical protein
MSLLPNPFKQPEPRMIGFETCYQVVTDGGWPASGRDGDLCLFDDYDDAESYMEDFQEDYEDDLRIRDVAIRIMD